MIKTPSGKIEVIYEYPEDLHTKWRPSVKSTRLCLKKYRTRSATRYGAYLCICTKSRSVVAIISSSDMKDKTLTA